MTAKRGRPRKNPDRLARSPSGPSGKGRAPTAAELKEQRAVLLPLAADLGAHLGLPGPASWAAVARAAGLCDIGEVRRAVLDPDAPKARHVRLPTLHRWERNVRDWMEQDPVTRPDIGASKKS